MQEHRNNMIFQYNRICESGLIQKNQLNLRIDGIVNHTPLVNQYGLKEVGYTQHYKTRNDKEELLNVGNWFSDKLKTQSYDRPIDANITLSWSKKYKNMGDKFKKKILQFETKDIILNKLIEVVVGQLISYILSSDINFDYKVYNTNLYDDIISGTDFIVEKRNKYYNKVSYVWIDLTSSLDKVDSDAFIFDFFVSQALYPKSIPRKVLCIRNYNMVYSYLSLYMNKMYEKETTDLDQEDMKDIINELISYGRYENNLIRMKTNLSNLLAA